MKGLSQEEQFRHAFIQLAGALARRRHLALALLLHGVAIGALYYAGPHQASWQRQERQFASTERVATQMRTQQRVQDLEKIKALLEQSRKAPREDARTEIEPVQFAATPQPRQDEELLAKARELSESIAVIDQQNRAEELAKVLGIGEEAARTQIASEEAAQAAQGTAPADGIKPDGRPGTDGGAAAQEIAQLEAQARAALARRQKQLERSAGGVQVEGSSDSRKLSERIGEFMNRDVPLKQQKDSTYQHPWRGIFNAGEGRMAPVNAAAMAKASGRVVGAGGEFTNRLYVNNWYVIGPFAGNTGRALFDNPSYPPEKGVFLDAVYRGKNDRLLKWQYMSKQAYPLVPPDYAEDGIWYGYTELMVDQAQEVTMWIGADDDGQLWVNDRLVWRGGNVNKMWFWREIYDTRNTYVRDFNLAEGARRVQLNKGRNKLVFKLSNGPARTFFSLVVSR